MKRTPRAASSSGPAPRTARRRTATGPPRPRYLLSEDNDRLMMIITALVAELSALRERLDTHEALGERKQFATSRRVEGLKLSPARREQREKERQALLARVFRVILDELDPDPAQAMAAAADLAQATSEAADE